jgi:hypothetical protein
LHHQTEKGKAFQEWLVAALGNKRFGGGGARKTITTSPQKKSTKLNSDT